MGATFASKEWIETWWLALRGSEAYREASHSWRYGPLALIVERSGSDPATAIIVDTHQGEARSVQHASVRETDRLPFVLSASAQRWQQVLEGKVDLVDAMLQGRIRVRGDLPTFTRERSALSAMIAVGGHIDTDYPVVEAPTR